MIVNNVNSSSKYYSNSVATRYAGATTAARGVQHFDSFMPSQAAQSFSDMLNKLKNTSEVREQRVNELREQIAAGQYFVPATDIAASILTNRH